jgi:hypothetical protein
MHDLRFAVRMLFKNPGFTLVAVLSLAIGIGVNSAMFSLADALLLRPLSVSRPGEVVSVEGKTPGDPAGRSRAAGGYAAGRVDTRPVRLARGPYARAAL